MLYLLLFPIYSRTSLRRPLGRSPLTYWSGPPRKCHGGSTVGFSRSLSQRYFTALSKGEVPPVKARFEIVTDSNGGLSNGRLATLHKQFGGRETVSSEELKEKWTHIGCEESKLSEILRYNIFNSISLFKCTKKVYYIIIMSVVGVVEKL